MGLSGRNPKDREPAFRTIQVSVDSRFKSGAERERISSDFNSLVELGGEGANVGVQSTSQRGSFYKPSPFIKLRPWKAPS